MANIEIAICDNCEKRKGEGKCCMCKKDLCGYCSRPSLIIDINSVGEGWQTFGRVTLCKDCKKKLIKIDGKLIDDEFAKKIEEQIGSYLLKKTVIEEI